MFPEESFAARWNPQEALLYSDYERIEKNRNEQRKGNERMMKEPTPPTLALAPNATRHCAASRWPSFAAIKAGPPPSRFSVNQEPPPCRHDQWRPSVGRLRVRVTGRGNRRKQPADRRTIPAPRRVPQLLPYPALCTPAGSHPPLSPAEDKSTVR